MSKVKRTEAGLSEEDIARFRELLIAKKAEILSSVWSMEDESIRRSSTDLSSLPMHMADLGSDNFEIENTIGLMESERRILSDIEEALQRIEDGSYGVCDGLGETIGKKRLEAIPWARYCVKCAALNEAGQLFDRDTDVVEIEDDDEDD